MIHFFFNAKHGEKNHHKNLRQRLKDVLTPSTTQAELSSIPRRGHYAPYLRFKQKQLDRGKWLVDGMLHLGAHFPLCVFTKNARARRKAKTQARAAKSAKAHASHEETPHRRGASALRATLRKTNRRKDYK